MRGDRREAKGYWLLAMGYWLLAIGYWLLVMGYWLLAIGNGREEKDLLKKYLLTNLNLNFLWQNLNLWN